MLLFDQSTMRVIYCVWYDFSTFCDVIVVKYFYFMKNSLHWYPSPCIKNDYKIGLLGNFRRMYDLVYCVIQGIDDRAPRPYLYTRMRLRLWLSKVRKVNQFMLATFSTSLILRRHVIRF